MLRERCRAPYQPREEALYASRFSQAPPPRLPFRQPPRFSAAPFSRCASATLAQRRAASSYADAAMSAASRLMPRSFRAAAISAAPFCSATPPAHADALYLRSRPAMPPAPRCGCAAFDEAFAARWHDDAFSISSPQLNTIRFYADAEVSAAPARLDYRSSNVVSRPQIYASR